MNPVLLSFSHKDINTANQVSELLSALSIESFLDLDSLNLQAAMGVDNKSPLGRYQIAIIILSDEVLQSDWVKLTFAYTMGANKKVIAFLTSEELELPQYMNNVLYTSTIDKLQEYLMGCFADLKIAKNSSKLLSKDQTSKLIKLHQVAVAHLVIERIDQNIEFISKSPADFDEEYLRQDIVSSIHKSTTFIDGFESEALGDLNEYFTRIFPGDALREHVKKAAKIMTKNHNPSSVRPLLINQLRDIQEQLFARVLKDLHNST